MKNMLNSRPLWLIALGFMVFSFGISNGGNRMLVQSQKECYEITANDYLAMNFEGDSIKFVSDAMILSLPVKDVDSWSIEKYDQGFCHDAEAIHCSIVLSPSSIDISAPGTSAEARLYDMNGRVVKSAHCDGQCAIPTESLGPGAYVIKIGSLTSKLWIK